MYKVNSLLLLNKIPFSHIQCIPLIVKSSMLLDRFVLIKLDDCLKYNLILNIKYRLSLGTKVDSHQLKIIYI